MPSSNTIPILQFISIQVCKNHLRSAPEVRNEIIARLKAALPSREDDTVPGFTGFKPYAMDKQISV